MVNDFNDAEKEFLEDLRTADSYVPSGYELEINRWWSCYNDTVPGWYAYKYSKEMGGSYPLEEYSSEPIITEAEALKKEINVEKCLDYYGCYYVG